MKQRFPLLLIGAVSALLFLGTSTLAQDFHGCPVEGKGGDPALNQLKNRTEVPAAFESIDFEELADLALPTGVSRKPRAHWSAATLAAVGPQEQRPVQVVGHQLDARILRVRQRREEGRGKDRAGEGSREVICRKV